jgi:hypothetical protein
MAPVTTGDISERMQLVLYDELYDRMRIPIEAGHVFRREGGRHSGLKPATSPK